MEKDINSVDNSSSSSDRQNVSFKFTKTTSKTLIGNRLDDKLRDSKNEKDYLFAVTKGEIKSSIPKVKEKDLVIPLIRQNNWRMPNDSENGVGDKESKLQELAIQELLEESSMKNEEWEKREFKNYTVSIPLIMQNKIPEGFETDEKLDVALRPDESKLEDYEKVPVEQYGLAILRGMGWKDGDPIGANSNKVAEPVQVQLRPKGLGLGADTTALKKSQEKRKEEKLELVKGSYVHIIEGPHKGFYGEVLGLDEDNARAIVKLSVDQKIVTFPEFYIDVVTKKEYEKESKVINRASYEKFKTEKESKELEAKSQEKEPVEQSTYKYSERVSKEERKRSYDTNSSKPQDSRSQKHSKKRRHSRDRGEEYLSHSAHRNSKSWLRPQLRVRLIDDKYKKGKYFNEKVVVVDVFSSSSCSCKTADGKYLDDISPSMLETVIPRSEPGYVMIVKGSHSGELCTILKKDKSKCVATVQFLSDRSQALKIEYDSICEYLGDVEEFD